MAEYLELARVILERRESATAAHTTTFHLNEHQCNRLWRNLRLHYDYYSGTLLYLQPTFLLPIFREFHLIVTRADAIRQHFSSSCSWLQAAVLQGDNRHTFKLLNQDLQDCVRLFLETTSSLCSSLISNSDAISRRYEDMDSDSEMDLSNLRTQVQQFTSRSEDEKSLAEYIVERENCKSSTDSDEDASLPRFYTRTFGYPPSLRKHIGGGAFSSVYEAIWLGMTCAMKHFNATVDENLMQEFMKEVKALAPLNHPHIVKLLYVGDVTEASYLMEYMPNNLRDYFKERRRNSEPSTILAKIDIMQQLARGMEHVHEQKIVHRDIKPSNILVAPSADERLRREGYVDVKLADFGLAKVKVRDATRPTRDKIGTTNWRAPEAFASSEAIKWEKADVYSFAMTCSEFLTGERPFMSGEVTKLYFRITSGERPVLPPTCPKDLRTLLQDCWHTKARRRPSFTEIRKKLTSIKASLLKGPDSETTLIDTSQLQGSAPITNNPPAPIESKLVEMKCASEANSSPTTSVEALDKCVEKPVLTRLTQDVGSKHTFLSSSPIFILVTILVTSLIIVPFITSWIRNEVSIEEQ